MKLLIEVQGNKPLSAYGDNHVIAYDSTRKSYYVTTAESFFASQNAKIKKIEEQTSATKERILSLQQELAGFEDMIQNQTTDFKQEINNRFNEFLHTYQETNAKLIAMVKELINAKEE